MTEQKVMVFKMEAELKEKVERLAKEDDRTQAYIIKKAIKALPGEKK